MQSLPRGSTDEAEEHPVDATGMAEAGAMAKIGAGRDAADVSLLTSFGPTNPQRKVIDVEAI